MINHKQGGGSISVLTRSTSLQRGRNHLCGKKAESKKSRQDKGDDTKEPRKSEGPNFIIKKPTRTDSIEFKGQLWRKESRESRYNIFVLHKKTSVALRRNLTRRAG